MQTQTLWPTAATRTPLAALTKLTIGALIGIALALVYVQALLVGAFAPDLSVFAALMLLGAALLTTGWRWTPIVGALLSSLVIAGNSGPVVYDITHPAAFHSFAFMVVAVALALVGTVAGLGATLQNYRSAARRAPRGTVVALATLTGLCVGALLVGALPQAASAGVSPEILAQLPAISTPEMHFDRSELKATVDQVVALRFDNTHVAPHSFDIDELNVHVPVASGKQGVVLFTPTQPGSYTFYCGVPGHREAGMVGTLIVEP